MKSAGSLKKNMKWLGTSQRKPTSKSLCMLPVIILYMIIATIPLINQTELIVALKICQFAA